MKRRILQFGPWVILLAIGTIAVPRTANTAPAPVPPAGEYPRMRAAASALRDARNELERAKGDFCGRRREAIRATDEALREINGAIACRR